MGTFCIAFKSQETSQSNHQRQTLRDTSLVKVIFDLRLGKCAYLEVRTSPKCGIRKSSSSCIDYTVSYIIPIQKTLFVVNAMEHGSSNNDTEVIVGSIGH